MEAKPSDLQVPAEPQMTSAERAAFFALLETPMSRVGRLLVLLVEHDGLAVDRAAVALGITAARALELLGSFKRITAITEDQRVADERRASLLKVPTKGRISKAAKRRSRQ